MFFFFLGFSNYWFYGHKEAAAANLPLIKKSWLYQAVAAILVLLAVYNVYFFSIRPAYASYYAGKARSLLLAQNYQSSLNFLARSRAFRADVVDERVATEMAKGILKNLSAKSEMNRTEADYLLKTMAIMEETVNKHPYILLNYTLLAQIYNLAGNVDKSFYETSIRLSNIAIEKLYSKRIETYRNLAFSYLGLGEKENAIAAMQKGIDLNPDFGYSYSLMAGVYHQLGDIEKEKEFLKKASDYNYFISPKK
jgi:tetratricopeptide (TPR) repeat protein